MTAEALRALLSLSGLSTRALARMLDVSPMWVSRRATGAVPITTSDAAAIVAALESVGGRR